MGLSQERQQKLDIKSSISRIVLEIKDLTSKKSYEIAADLGVEPETISRGESEQLLKALELLLEVEQLKRLPPPKSNRELILELEARVALIEKGLKNAPYPPHRPQHLEVNDAANSGQNPDTVSKEDTEHIAIETARRAEAERSTPPK